MAAKVARIPQPTQAECECLTKETWADANPSMDTAGHQSLLEELDARQEEVLLQLDELAARLDRVLQDCQSLRGVTADAA